MSNSQSSADHKGGTNPLESGDGRDELKTLLDTIAVQLKDADQRHMSALSEMQERISGMGREADELRSRIPDELGPAFERIEAGIGELAHRLADATENSHDPTKSAQSATARQSYPAGLASADPSNPWSQETADALADAYGHTSAGESEADGAASSGIDEAWLESRFAEIARGIEYSLASAKPEKSISELSERIDQFERQFSKVFAGVATHDDLAVVRQIEEHMDEVVHRLEKTNDQLERLNTLEAQIANVSKTLAEMQAASAQASGTQDIASIARAVAEETAQRFASARPNDELRPLIEQLMTEHRQGGEQTSAALDTMQQAMIRLLDRIDPIDFPTTPNMPAYPGEAGGTLGFGPNPQFDGFGETVPVPPVVPTGSFQASPPLAEDLLEQSEKLRREFVADVRRAKARLTEEDDGVPAGPSRTVLPGSRPIRPSSASASKNAFGPSGPSPRLIVIGVLVLILLAGLWATLGFGGRNNAPVSAPSASSEPAQVGIGTSSRTDFLKAPASEAPSDTPSDSGSTSPQPTDGGGPRGDAAPNSGNTDAERNASEDEANPAPRTALPMLGVAVDLDRPASLAELQQARRHQAMAEMSGALGYSAGQPGESTPVPSSMVPSEAETEGAQPSDQPTPQPMSATQGVDGAVKMPSLEMPEAMIGPLSLRLAAANGDPSAQFEVGARYAEGQGVKQSFKDAAKWYQRSADQGFAQARYRLATLYERGLGLKPDRAQAADLYERAAGQGNIKAMHNLAVLSANQDDRAPDYTTAAHWFGEAAKRGLPDSQFNLAILYENGLGVEKDLKQAYMWLSIAARAGDVDAKQRRNIVRGKLTAQEIADVEKSVATWRLTPSDRSINDALLAGTMWKKNPKNGVSG